MNSKWLVNGFWDAISLYFQPNYGSFTNTTLRLRWRRGNRTQGVNSRAFLTKSPNELSILIFIASKCNSHEAGHTYHNAISLIAYIRTNNGWRISTKTSFNMRFPILGFEWIGARAGTSINLLGRCSATWIANPCVWLTNYSGRGIRWRSQWKLRWTSGTGNVQFLCELSNLSIKHILILCCRLSWVAKWHYR